MTLLRKQGLWLIFAMMAGIAGGWLVHAGQSVAYTSTAQVDIEPHVIANTTPVAPNMSTEKQVATSGVVLASIARTLGATSLALAKDLKANASGTSNILSIACTMPTPSAAQRCAAAAADGYVAFRDATTASPSVRAHDPLRATLVTPASLPQSPAGLGKKILLPLGAILGLLLGIGAIFIRDRMDGRVRDRADLERCLGAPVLAAVPRVRRRAGRPASVFSRAPLSPAAEAYRHLRVRLEPLIALASDRAAVLLVTSGGAREGRTSVAANLAAARAHAGGTVILVDADLRHPSLSTIFDTGERPGLTDLLSGRASIEEVAVPTDVPRLSDIAVVVADLRRTHRADVSAAIRDLRAAEPRAIVSVLNNVRRPLRAHQGRPKVPGGPQWLAPSASVPSALAAVVPPPGPNGKGRTLSRERRTAEGD